MARSMSSPWLFNAFAEIFHEVNTENFANMTNKKWPAKVVQVVSCNVKLNSLLVSDSEKTIHVFLTQKCFDSVSEMYSLSSFKNCHVKIANFHFSTVVQAAGHHGWEFLGSQGISGPLAILCSKLTYMGASDLEIIGSPTELNKDPRVKAVLDQLQYFSYVEKLVSRQFHTPVDAVKRLPNHDCVPVILERYSEENLPKLSHSIIPEDQMTILDARLAIEAVNLAKTGSSQSSSSQRSVAVSQSQPTSGAVTTAATSGEAVNEESQHDSQNSILYGESSQPAAIVTSSQRNSQSNSQSQSQNQDVQFIGQHQSQPVDSQVIRDIIRNNNNNNNNSNSSAKEVALFDKLASLPPVVVHHASVPSSPTPLSPFPQRAIRPAIPYPAEDSQATTLNNMLQLSQEDSEELHDWLHRNFSSQVWTNLSSPTRPASATATAAADMSGSQAAEVMVHHLVGRSTLQRVGKHVFRGIVVEQTAENKFVVQYEQDGDIDEMSEEDLMRIIVPEEIPASIQPSANTSSAPVNNNNASSSSSGRGGVRGREDDEESLATQRQEAFTNNNNNNNNNSSSSANVNKGVMSPGGHVSDIDVDESPKKRARPNSTVSLVATRKQPLPVAEGKAVYGNLFTFMNRINTKANETSSSSSTTDATVSSSSRSGRSRGTFEDGQSKGDNKAFLTDLLDFMNVHTI